MAVTTAIAAIGTVLKLGDGVLSTAPTFTAIAEVLSINGPTLSRDQIDVTHQATTGGFREFIGGLGDAGEVTFDISYVPSNTTHDVTAGLLKWLDSGLKTGFRVEWSDSPSTNWEFDAQVNGFEVTAAVDEQLKASVTLRLSGKPNFDAT